MKKIYGYARVSTKEQHLDRQIKALLDHGIDERDIVSDHASGASLERPGYHHCTGPFRRCEPQVTHQAQSVSIITKL